MTHHGLSEGRLIGRRDWAPGLVTLTIEAEIEPFAPGQFVNLALERDGQLDRRSYSIASAPGAPLAFLVAEVPEGVLTPHLMRLAPGDRVWVEPKPQGFFTLRWVPDAPELWLVATGTGLGPFLSILGSEELWQRFPQVVVVHGVRGAEQLAHREELRALSADRPGLRVVPVLSRELGSGHVSGRVTTALDDGTLEAAAGLTLAPDRSHVMLCGNPAMIDEMSAKLGARGLKKHRVRAPGHITVEKYW